MRLIAWLVAAFLIAPPAMAQAGPQPAVQTPADAEAAVRAAVFDYVDALYQRDPERIRRSVSPELVKYGVSFPAEGGARWSAMSYDQLVGLADRYNAADRDMSAEPRDVQILSLESRIAAARLTARWGVDYLLLVRDGDGRWRIRQVVWEGRAAGNSSGAGR